MRTRRVPNSTCRFRWDAGLGRLLGQSLRPALCAERLFGRAALRPPHHNHRRRANVTAIGASVQGQPTHHFFDGSKARLSYFEWGEPDAPPILLAHATGFHARVWDQTIAALPGRLSRHRRRAARSRPQRIHETDRCLAFHSPGRRRVDTGVVLAKSRRRRPFVGRPLHNAHRPRPAGCGFGAWSSSTRS